jgi:subtilisin family serine protease
MALAILAAPTLFLTGSRDAAAIEASQPSKKKQAVKRPQFDPRKALPGQPGLARKPNAPLPATNRNTVNPVAPNTVRGDATKPTLTDAKLRENATNPPAPRDARGNAVNVNPANTRFGNSAALNSRDGRANATRTNAANAVAANGRVRRGPAVTGATASEREAQRLQHRSQILSVQRRLPYRPLPGERNFTGVPPPGETRFVSTEVVLQVGPNVPQQSLDDVARRYNLTPVAAQRSALTGGTLFHFRLADGRGVPDVVRALEAERIGVAQPNYVYRVTQAAVTPPRTPAEMADHDQYVAQKLRLEEAHKMATGKNVLVAVLDSAIDRTHPDLANAVVETFDAAGGANKPHPHGTGMVGAIAAHGRLTGIAPDVRVLAVNAFNMNGQQSPQATTRNIIAGLEWALAKGARVINMSFTGPYDPMLQLAMKKAHEKGAVLIAAAGNQGPKSPPLYPAADPNVIAVTATDENDGLYSGANRGPYVAVATPGVDILVPAPGATYELTTGTSVAAAHASGVAALLIERHPEVDAKTILEVLTVSAEKLGAQAPDDQFGWGLIDPVSALDELDSRVADGKVAAMAKPAPPYGGL